MAEAPAGFTLRAAATLAGSIGRLKRMANMGRRADSASETTLWLTTRGADSAAGENVGRARSLPGSGAAAGGPAHPFPVRFHRFAPLARRN